MEARDKYNKAVKDKKHDHGLGSPYSHTGTALLNYLCAHAYSSSLPPRDMAALAALQRLGKMVEHCKGADDFLAWFMECEASRTKPRDKSKIEGRLRLVCRGTMVVYTSIEEEKGQLDIQLKCWAAQSFQPVHQVGPLGVPQALHSADSRSMSLAEYMRKILILAGGQCKAGKAPCVGAVRAVAYGR